MYHEWVALMAYCAASAGIVRGEPTVYASLRLVEVLEKLLSYGEKNGITHQPAFRSIARQIALRKDSCMEDPEAFYRFIDRVALDLVKYLDGTASI